MTALLAANTFEGKASLTLSVTLLNPRWPSLRLRLPIVVQGPYQTYAEDSAKADCLTGGQQSLLRTAFEMHTVLDPEMLPTLPARLAEHGTKVADHYSSHVGIATGVLPAAEKTLPVVTTLRQPFTGNAN